MELKLLQAQGQAGGTVEVSDVVFGRDYNEALVHQVVVAYMANARSGNRAQKGRSDIAKSTRKPWRQKGTGRARAGMASSPLWRGGGQIFPSSPDDNFSQKVNRKMYRAGLATILSQLARDERIAVVEEFGVTAPKTRELASKLKELGVGPVLVITDDLSENLLLASRNLRDVLVLDVNEADPVSLVKFPQVLITKSALSKLQEGWQ